MSGAGIGGTLGTIAGAALAPETGGLSLAIPGALGAAGGFIGGKLTGSKNPLMDAFLGGAGGALGGAAGLGGDLGISDSAGLFGDAATGAAGAGEAAAEGAGSGALGAGADLADTAGQTAADASAGAANSDSFLPANFADSMQMGATPQLGSALSASSPLTNVAADPSLASQAATYLGKQNPLNLALAGGAALSGIQALLPQKKVDVAKNAADTIATSPGFTGSLPKYTVQNTASPYTGDWYKYGFTPQPAMYNGQPQLAMKRGGEVRGYAQGGPMIPQGSPMPQGMPPQMQSALSQIPVNPLTLSAAHQAGAAVGKHLKQTVMGATGKVTGPGGGQDDAVPAKLSDGEYVVPAEVVSQLGDGSTNAGASKLDGMVKKVRSHKTKNGSGFPPKAKNPLSYIPKGKA